MYTKRVVTVEELEAMRVVVFSVRLGGKEYLVRVEDTEPVAQKMRQACDAGDNPGAVLAAYANMAASHHEDVPPVHIAVDIGPLKDIDLYGDKEKA